MATLGTPFSERLGLRYPIFGLSHSVDVTVALAEAGGYPVYSMARETPDESRARIAEIKARIGGRPFAVDLLLPSKVGDQTDRAAAEKNLPEAHRAFVAALRAKYKVPAATKPNFFSSQIRSRQLFEAQIAAALDSGAHGFAAAVGLPPEAIAAAKRAGMMTFSLVGAPKHARAALDAGIDVLVAQGYDAGGHTGLIGTLTLVPQIVEAARGKAPVLAAGGIGHGSQIAASFALGAEGAWLGTAWLASREHALDEPLLKRLLAAGSADTVITRSHSGKPARVVRSEWSDAWEAPDAPKPLAMPYQQVLIGELLAAIEEHGVAPLRYEAAGQSIAWFNDVRSVAEIVERLVGETVTALADLRRVSSGS